LIVFFRVNLEIWKVEEKEYSASYDLKPEHGYVSQDFLNKKMLNIY